MSWRDFWNGEHSIYVNARHRTLHYDRVAKDVVSLIPSAQTTLLDYGCGDALAADYVVDHCARLYLFDTSEAARTRVRRRLGADTRVAILDEAQFAALPENALDMILCCSVLQYVAASPTDALLGVWHDKLRPGGRLVIADVISPDTPMATDVKALLTFALQGGFLLAALRGLVATFFSRYRVLRNEIGLTTYREDDMASLLRLHGFSPERMARNVGHNQARMTFVATRI